VPSRQIGRIAACAYGRVVLDDSTDRPMLALGLRLAGIGAMAGMGALIKAAGVQGANLVEIIFWRQAASVVLILAWVLATGTLSSLATKRPKAHFTRSFYGMVGMTLNFGALLLLPLAEAVTMSFSAPIFAVVLSVLLLGEKVHAWRWGAVAAGFVGVLVIAQPGGDHLPLVGAAAGLAGAFMIALISIHLRDLTRTEQSLTIVFWFGAVTVICALPLMLAMGQAHNGLEWLLLAGIGVAGTIGQILITLALRYGKVSSVIVMDYSGLVWATLLGWLIFSDLPPLTTWIGAPLVVGAGLVIAWREQIRARRKPIEPHPITGTEIR